MNRRPSIAGLAEFLLCGVALTGLPQAAGETNPDPKSAQPISPSTAAATDHETLSLRGRVVWLADALQQLHGIQTVPESRDRVLVLQTDDGQLHPLVEDIRGRGIRRDERLRNTPCELLVRKHDGSPFVQVIRFFAVREDGKYELDYWCEICAIATFEIKPCECCQGPVELRERRVDRY